MYQKMFDEEGAHFLGLIISPYYSVPDLPPGLNSLPHIRCFINYKDHTFDTPIPFEIPITSLLTNPYATDHIHLNKESCAVKKRYGS